VLLADVYGDGNLDAITTEEGGNEIDIAAGDGKGHLYGDQRLPVPGVNSTYTVAVADLNGDGIPDIVGTTNNGIFVILGKGSRKFAKAVTFDSGGQQPYGIAVGDLNHDGIPDLVVANNGTQQNGDYGNVAVLLGKGDGSFEKPVGYRAGKDPYALVLADFNRDGNLDMAVVGPTLLGPRNVVRILLGKGDGTFGPPKAYPSGLYPISIVTADFNGDGIPDLAVANYTNPSPCHVSVMLGNGDGSFQPPVKFRVGVSPEQLIVADFTHDGKPDIATINGGDSTISILLNTTRFPTPSPLK
jgi:FG-GAP-like repeat